MRASMEHGHNSGTHPESPDFTPSGIDPEVWRYTEEAVRFHIACMSLLSELLEAAGEEGVFARELFMEIKPTIDAAWGDGSYTWDVFESNIEVAAHHYDIVDVNAGRITLERYRT